MTSLDLTSKTCVPTLKLLGDYWTLRIIDALEPGELRFCEVQRMVDNLNPVTLTDRLKKLEDANLVNRSEETVDKISVVYSLTHLGRETLPVLGAINTFSSKAKKLA
jgi:DNA-binding HxlR family transcriptional regulator